MKVTICDNRKQLGYQAAQEGAYFINQAISERGEANVVFVTGKSQVMTLFHLTQQNVDWTKVNIYHLDEFIGIEQSSMASSYSFLNEYLLSKIGKVKSYHPIDSGKDNVGKTIAALNKELNAHPLDVAFICIGENGHLAFNDPPADFDTTDPYILVNLERRSRKQQVSEGWFKNLDDVPEEAITMSVSQILSSKHIIVSCPDQRKAKAVAACLFEDISPLSPSSALRYAASCSLYLDRLSSCLVFGDRRTN